MHIVLVGLNHRSAPVELRERLAFRDDQLQGAFARLRNELAIREAAILSTCNRVEIYAGVPELQGTIEGLQRFLGDHGAMEAAGLAPRLYSYTEPQSVHHLFSVASGLDSMVIGEAEILHQVKRAYELARQHEATGKVLNVLFQRALNTAKTVRTRTGIGRGCTSVGSVAVELAQKIFGSLDRSTVLLLGAGKIGEVTLKRLAVRGVRDVRVANRSFERGARVAELHRACAVPWEQLAAQLVEADIVISSTSAPGAILSRSEVASAMQARRQRPLCLIDLGVPRNVEPAVGSLENVYLFDIDDLQGLIDHHHEERQRAAEAARVIIEQKVHHFVSSWSEEGSTPCAPSSSGPVAAR